MRMMDILMQSLRNIFEEMKYKVSRIIIGTWLVKVLLQVFVTFYTMIATVCQHNIPVRCNCYSLRSVYLASRGVNEGEE